MADETKISLQVHVAPALRDAIEAFAESTGRDLGTTISRSSAIEILIRSGLKVRGLLGATTTAPAPGT